MIKSMKMKISWACSMHGREVVYEVLMRKPEGRRLLGSPRHRWDNIKVDNKEIL
jgi:hypothetical protein